MNLLLKAKALAERVEAEATKVEVAVAVSVVDVHGDLVLQHRMTGAQVASLEASERKAYTSAVVGIRTVDLLAFVRPGQAIYPLPTVAGGRVCPVSGGVPLFDDEARVFAGIGVSGGTAEQDAAIVEAAIR